MNFLNIKTNYNLGLSTITIDELVEYGQANNLTSLFLTDNNLQGVADFCFACNKKNIKPIIGLALTFDFGELILIAKTYQGYLTLVRIVNHFKNNQIKDLNLLLEQNLVDLVIIIEFQERITEIFKTIKSVSENCNFFIGLNSNSKFDNLNRRIEKYVWMEEINCLNNVHEQSLNIINKKSKIKKVLTDEQLAKLIKINIHNETIDKIIDLIDFNIFNDLHLNFYHENSNEKASEIIRDASLKVIDKYCKSDRTKEIYINRLNYELTIIKKLNFCNYFLTVSEILKIARENEIFVGPGRGSAAGSLIAFCLKITMIDPIRYDLLFERFLNPDRIGYPDIDIDIQDNKREELLTILNERYKNKFALISTYKTYGYKKAIQLYFENNDKDVDIKQKISLFVNAKDNCLNYETIEKDNNLKSDFIEVIKNLAKVKETISTHPAGVILTETDIAQSFPIFNLKFNQIQFQGEYLEKLGLIKIDLLALSNLTGLIDFTQSVKKNTNEKINLRFISFNEKTFKVLGEGKTTGIFQLGSKGITDTIMQIKPKNIFEVADVLALYRPGPIEQIPIYVKRKKQGFNYNENDQFLNVLKSTYGIMIYQEQVMMILQRLANFNLVEADNIRRAISKKDLVLLKKYEDLFIENAVKNHLKREEAITKWNWILKFANYGFNKSHAVSYAMIVCWYAYFKANYPLDFYTVNLNRSNANYLEYINEIYETNIKIKTPSILDQHQEYIYKDNEIILPLHAINGVSKDIYKKLNISQNATIFKVIKSLKFDCSVDLKTFKNLVYANVFDVFKKSKNVLIEVYKLILQGGGEDNISSQKIQIKKDLVHQLIVNEYLAFGFNLKNNNFLNLNIDKDIRDELTDLKFIKVDQSVYALGIITKIKLFSGENKKNYRVIDFFSNNNIYQIYLFNDLYERFKKDIIENNLCIFKINSNLKNNSTLFELKEIVKSFNEKE